MCSADGLREIFTNTETYSKGLLFETSLREWLGLGLVTNSGASWKAERARLTPFFHLAKLRSYCADMNAEARRLSAALARSAGEPLELPPLVAETALRVIVRAVFGSRLDIDAVWQLWRRNTDSLRAFLVTSLFLPGWVARVFPIRGLKEFYTTLTELNQLFERVVLECRAAPSDADSQRDLIAQMALLKDADGNFAIDAQMIVDESKTFTFAGILDLV